MNKHEWVLGYYKFTNPRHAKICGIVNKNDEDKKIKYHLIHK